jgi:hypothetical protein
VNAVTPSPETAQTADALATPKQRGLPLFPWVSYAFITFFVAALAAFWPPYLSKLPGGGFYRHFHATAMTLWFGLLISQPLLAKTGHYALHRWLGRTSFVLAPVAVLSMVLLTHARVQRYSDPLAVSFTMILPLAMAAIFAAAYTLAVRYRRQTALHARYMICTAFALVDPVGARLISFYVSHNLPVWAYQVITFMLTDLIVLWLIWRERHTTRGRTAFPVMLALMVPLQVSVFTLPFVPAWQAVARWFRALPLT